ncbi:response regulator transcription factor [Pseudonocardia sp. MH-G8]|uniref:response regulator transcription factor n=1 Tax=Pseudonocardia sp. MH-G8 TaxID=1854588 RepID=UPI000BA09A53|nr:response regulator transcription factor [Pseudonocardia sp. MH-G8]OZM77778.1 DNA-binding response regulator [Pseudonocardia sp. MH-G8]
MVVRVVVVDRQPLFRRQLEQSLPAATEGGVRVVAGTDLAANAGLLVRRHLPDVALLDLELAAPGVLAALAAMRRVQPRLPVLVLTGCRGEHRRLVDVLAAGASGVLLKTRTPADLVPSLLAATGTLTPPDRPAGPRLTEAEQRLWMLIGGGGSTSEIARAMHVSERTVKRLTARLLRTLGVANRTEAAALAGRAGLLDGSPHPEAAIPMPRPAAEPSFPHPPTGKGHR